MHIYIWIYIYLCDEAIVLLYRWPGKTCMNVYICEERTFSFPRGLKIPHKSQHDGKNSVYVIPERIFSGGSSWSFSCVHTNPLIAIVTLHIYINKKNKLYKKIFVLFFTLFYFSYFIFLYQIHQSFLDYKYTKFIISIARYDPINKEKKITLIYSINI